MNWKHLVTLGCALSLAMTGCTDDDGDGGGTQSYGEFKQSAQSENVDLLCSATYDCPEKQTPFDVMFLGRFADKEDSQAI